MESSVSRASFSMFLTRTFILSTDLDGLISLWSIRSCIRTWSSLSSMISSPMAVWVKEEAMLATELGMSVSDTISIEECTAMYAPTSCL